MAELHLSEQWDQFEDRFAKRAGLWALCAILLAGACVYFIPVNKSEPADATTDKPEAGEKILSGVKLSEPVRLSQKGPVLVGSHKLSSFAVNKTLG